MTLLSEFRTFVAAQPPEKEYNHYARDCALGQFADARFGAKRVENVGYYTIQFIDDKTVLSYDEEVCARLVGAISGSRTFGELSTALESI